MFGTIAMLIAGAAISAGSQVASSAIAAHAAGKAAKQQIAAGDKALALNSQIYEDQKRTMAPWVNQGGQAINTLGALMGLPSGPVGGDGPPSALPPALPGMSGPQQRQVWGQRREERPMFGQGGPGAGPGSPGGFAGPNVPGMPSTDLVQMQAPDGEIRAVPRALVAKIQAAGGRLVSGA